MPRFKLRRPTLAEALLGLWMGAVVVFGVPLFRDLVCVATGPFIPRSIWCLLLTIIVFWPCLQVRNFRSVLRRPILFSAAPSNDSGTPNVHRGFLFIVSAPGPVLLRYIGGWDYARCILLCVIAMIRCLSGFAFGAGKHSPVRDRLHTLGLLHTVQSADRRPFLPVVFDSQHFGPRLLRSLFRSPQDHRRRDLAFESARGDDISIFSLRAYGPATRKNSIRLVFSVWPELRQEHG